VRAQSTAPGHVLVVDDDVGFRAFMRELLEAGGFRVVDVPDGAAALASVRSERPAAVLLDVNMPRLSGYEVCRALREEHGAAFPLMFVSGERTESFDRVAGLTIGADDYLAKPFEGDELLARVRSLLRRYAGTGAPVSSLTARELQVLGLLAEGLDQSAIAQRLVISSKTVGSHIERILAKLGAHSRAEAVALAYRLQLVPVPA
jgi:two-component system, NarL family, nitrate/nitrite response regulator NarL